MKARYLIAITAMILVVSKAFSQETDSRIERQLNSMGLKYDVTSTGNFKLLFELEDKRTQIVFINSSTKYYEDAEVREISSPTAFITNMDELTHQQLFMLLAENSQTTLGAWQLEAVADGWGLHFTVKVPALMPDKRLKMYLSLVAITADQMEKKLSNADIF